MEVISQNYRERILNDIKEANKRMGELFVEAKELTDQKGIDTTAAVLQKMAEINVFIEEIKANNLKLEEFQNGGADQLSEQWLSAARQLGWKGTLAELLMLSVHPKAEPATAAALISLAHAEEVDGEPMPVLADLSTQVTVPVPAESAPQGPTPSPSESSAKPREKRGRGGRPVGSKNKKGKLAPVESRNKPNRKEEGRLRSDLTPAQYKTARVAFRLVDDQTIPVDRKTATQSIFGTHTSAEYQEVAQKFSGNWGSTKHKFETVFDKVFGQAASELSIPFSLDQLDLLSDFPDVKEICQRLGEIPAYRHASWKEVIEFVDSFSTAAIDLWGDISADAGGTEGSTEGIPPAPESDKRKEVFTSFVAEEAVCLAPVLLRLSTLNQADKNSWEEVTNMGLLSVPDREKYAASLVAKLRWFQELPSGAEQKDHQGKLDRESKKMLFSIRGGMEYYYDHLDEFETLLKQG